MLINKNYITNVDILCPECNTNILAKDVSSIYSNGFECPSCKYKTSTKESAVGLLVCALLRNNRKIEAIKLYKTFTNKGLKESKQDVEQIANKFGIEMKKGCFIATVCYNSFDAHEVIVLRKYRDNVLSNNYLGKIFIKIYYAISPAIAYQIAKSPNLKSFFRNFLLAPIIRYTERKL